MPTQRAERAGPTATSASPRQAPMATPSYSRGAPSGWPHARETVRSVTRRSESVTLSAISCSMQKSRLLRRKSLKRFEMFRLLRRISLKLSESVTRWLFLLPAIPCSMQKSRLLRRKSLKRFEMFRSVPKCSEPGRNSYVPKRDQSGTFQNSPKTVRSPPRQI